MHIKLIGKSLYFIIIYCLIIISCKQQEKSERFVVPLDTMPVYKTTDSKIPSPNRAYYLPSNFVFDSSGNIFYYQQKILWNDDEVREWKSPPKFINLKLEDIVQIPTKSIEDFFKLNILKEDTLKRYVAIASLKDTITSLGLSKIIALCNEKSNHIRWKFRMATLEELVVLNYKKRQDEYYPDKIKWDSTKIQMKTSFLPSNDSKRTLQ